jgi:Tol biopolymer transport system component
MRWEVKLFTVGVVVALVVALTGCGSNTQSVFQNVFDRPTWSPTGTQLAFESVGGNALFFIWSVNSAGGSLTVLTPQLTDTTNPNQGGKMPAWSPSTTTAEMAMVATLNGGGQALYLINPVVVSSTPILKLTDDSVVGADSQPSWSADASKIVYVSNKVSGHFEIFTVNPAVGAASITRVLDFATVGDDAQWPVFSPDGTKIAFQKSVGATVTTNTQIWVYDTVAHTLTNLTPPTVPANLDRNDAPSWSPDGTTIAFDSNRNGTFDIWSMSATAGSNLKHLTADARSDGFPVYSKDGTHLAFTRDRELWTMNADGTNQLQLTQRF